MEWTWRKGTEGMKKTKREKKNIEEIKDDIVNEVLKFQDETMEARKNQMKEESNIKLSNRGLMIQRSVNPFMINSDYNKDLEVQNEFLIPKDSNI